MPKAKSRTAVPFRSKEELLRATQEIAIRMLCQCTPQERQRMAKRLLKGL